MRDFRDSLRGTHRRYWTWLGGLLIVVGIIGIPSGDVGPRTFLFSLVSFAGLALLIGAGAIGKRRPSQR